ncbi:MAG: ABC transporter ATP-binding protein [Lachnospiraceae bacterium]
MIKLKNINYIYPSGGNENSLSNFNLHVKAGEFIVLCGKSGCGKTTVTRLINGLIPHFYEGTFTGQVLIDGLDVAKTELSQVAKKVGSVFQNPKSQFFNVDTDGELAFGCENMALPREETIENVKKTVRELELEELLGRNIFHLSGGEKQQIACGSVYAANPNIYVLDEPSSNMDVAAIKRLQRILKIIKSEGNTIIISEHRLYYLMDLADRFIYIRNGRAIQSFSPNELMDLPDEKRMDLGLRTPEQSRVLFTGTTFIENCNASPAIEIEHLRCHRGKKIVLDIPKLTLPRHSVTAVIGENGAGKSTLIEILCGFLKHQGYVIANGRKATKKNRTQHSYMVMQDVNRQLFCASVLDELLLGLSGENEQFANEILEIMELSSYDDRHPASLSGGQKQRLAICAAIAARKKFLFYDEPTSGLDFNGMNSLCHLIRKNAEKTLATLVITHDFELVMGCCTHVLHLDKGKMIDYYLLDGEGIGKIKSIFVPAIKTAPSAPTRPKQCF